MNELYKCIFEARKSLKQQLQWQWVSGLSATTCGINSTIGCLAWCKERRYPAQGRLNIPVLFSLVCGAQLAPSWNLLWFALSGYKSSSWEMLQGVRAFSSCSAPFLQMSECRKEWAGRVAKAVVRETYKAHSLSCDMADHFLGALGSPAAGCEARLDRIFIQTLLLHEKVFFPLIFFWYSFAWKVIAVHGDTFIINICIFKATQGENFGTLKNINMDVVLQCLQAPEVYLSGFIFKGWAPIWTCK